MKLLGPAFLCILVIVLFPFRQLLGQVTSSDSAFYQAAVYNTITFYQQSTQDQPRVYNGRRYKPYRIGFISGTPFFGSGQFTEGEVIYEGGLYEKVKLLYDQVTDMLILNAGFAVELIHERVEQFTLSEHTFIRLVKDSINKLPATAYYERLYSGKIEILKKEKKTIKENLSDTEGVRGEILSKRYYYLKKNGHYYPVKNKSAVLDVLNDRANEIEQFIKYHHLNFKKDTDNTLVKIADYYDQLSR